MLLTTSTSPGKERSPVSIALCKNCLDCIQSRCSAPLRRVTMNSVIENGSSVPNTTEAVFLQAPFEQPDIKSRVIEHSAHTPASQILLVVLKKSVWTPRNWHQRCPTNNLTQNLTKDDQFAAGIAMIAIDHPHSHTVETVPPPRPHKHASAGTTVLKFQLKLLVRLHPLDNPSQNPWEHSIQNDWLKQINEQRCNKKPTHMLRGTQRINPNFIARPGNSNIDSTGCQDKPLPQTLNQLVTSAQLEYIEQGRNLGEHKKLKVSVSGSIRNQIFSERVFSVPNN